MKKYKLLRVTTVPASLKVLLKGQHQFMLNNGFDVLGVSSPGKELQEVKSAEGINVIGLEMTRTISPLKDLMSLWNFYLLCKKEKPLIVHSHTPKAGIVGMLGAKLAGVPIRLHTVAGMPLMETRGIKRFMLEMTEKLTYACACAVYPNSHGLQEFMYSRNLAPKKKIKLIGNGSSNGIDVNFFSTQQIDEQHKKSLRKQLLITDQDFVFIFVGRLVGDKGINELVLSFLSVVSKHPNAKLLLLGNLETELDPLSAETLHSILKEDRIINVGFKDDVRPYMAISDALVFPSYREGFPNVVMQAGAMDLPCIVTDINGCNEIIIDGKNGAIIPSKDRDALQAAMEKMISDDVWRNTIQKNSRKMIVARYEQRTIWDGILNEYRSHLKKTEL